MDELTFLDGKGTILPGYFHFSTCTFFHRLSGESIDIVTIPSRATKNNEIQAVFDWKDWRRKEQHSGQAMWTTSPYHPC